MRRWAVITCALVAVLPLRAELLSFDLVDGPRVAVFAKDQSKAVVLVFIDTECPIANAYHPELRRLEKEFGGKGVRFFLVHADPDTPVEKAKRHREEFGITAPVVIDKGQEWVKRTGATVTPEAVVISRKGKTIYQGRIDDRYADYGKKRPEPKNRDLHAALTAVVAGKPVRVAKTEAVGCKIFVE